MADTEKSLRRDEARKRFDTHGIEDASGEEVDVEVKPVLSAMLSLRLDQEHFKKLKTLARARKTGVTTLARRILQEALDDSAAPLSMKPTLVKEEVARVIAESKTPYGEGEPDFLVIPAEQLARVSRMVEEAARKMWIEALQSTAMIVTPDQSGLHEELRELGAARK
jgi:hypothetical protein